MCGIAGAIGPDAQRNAARMRVMRGRLIHRGPDSEGEALLDGAALGVRRLRIIDLRTGDQPQCNEHETVWTVFNGEIYNFRELRSELSARGHRFRTASDTEVIVHLYEDHGDEFVSRLDGMFTLALWDTRERVLVLARDRMGKKPLLYRVGDGEILFASEHAALLAGIEARPTPDPTALGLYLRLGYVPAPHDAFSGIQKLPPAHTLVWRAGMTEVRRYWSLPAPGTVPIGPTEAAREVRRLVQAAVERRLVADVPLGAFLSGGLDSSCVVATMAGISSRVRTFTIDFADPTYSEARYARLVAERFGTEHQELTVDPDDVEALDTLVRHYGEPFADSSALPTFYLSRFTRDHVTVALNGDGGDEVFAGYDRYVAARLGAWLDLVPVLARRLAGRVGALVPDHGRAGDRLRRFLEGVPLRGPDRYARWIRIFDERQLSDLCTVDLMQAIPSVAAIPIDGAWIRSDPVTSAQLFDLTHYLPDDLLVKVDIASMANSLEVRSPLLDRELLEFVLALPIGTRMPGLERKSLLRRAMSGILPEEILSRRKHGFSVPIGRWFRGPLRTYLIDVVLSERAKHRGFFRPEKLEGMVREHMARTRDHSHRLWALLVLEMWHREFIDRPTAVELRRPA